MPDNSSYYDEIGRKAARKSFAFPGLGQMHNKEYFKGTTVIVLFLFALSLLGGLLFSPQPRVGSWLIALLAAIPATLWGLSVYDAYVVAIDQRKRHATRYNVEILTTIRGYDVNQDGFEEITTTKNLSRMGACLVLSRMMSQGTQVSLEFEGNERVRGRVVWAKQKADTQEHLVGMELLSPLKQFEY